MKLQAPSSKLQGNIKSQAPNHSPGYRLGIWCLELFWGLMFGVWSFFRVWCFSGAWSSVLGAFLLLPSSAHATSDFYINDGIVSVTSPPTDPPQIDATNFVNNGIFAITNLSSAG